MKRFLGLAVIIALLSFVSTAHGAVAVWDEFAADDYYVGEATSIKIEGQDCSSDGSQVTILANGHKDDVTQPASPTKTQENNTSEISTAMLAYGMIQFADIGPLGSPEGVLGDVRWITLADGTPGQMVTIQILAATGGTLYISDDQVNVAIKQTGWDDIALATALDSVTLLYVDDTYGWIVVGQYGATIT